MNEFDADSFKNAVGSFKGLERDSEMSAEKSKDVTGETKEMLAEDTPSTSRLASKQKPAQGLRERKKEQTRLALETTILRLVIEKGYEDVTIEEVCEQVGISRKTFFNYFSSKRAAVLGRAYIPTKEQLLESLEKHSDHNYLDVVARCVEEGLTNVGASVETKKLRQEAMARSPEIFFRTNKSSLVMQPNIKNALFEYLSNHPEKRNMPDRDLDEECLIGTSVVVCLMRVHAMLTSYQDETVSMKEIRNLIGDYIQ